MQAAHCRSISILADTLKLSLNHPLCSLGFQQSELESAWKDSVGAGYPEESPLPWELLFLP